MTQTAGRILVVEDQMCSAIYPWQEVCSASNYAIQLEIVPYPESDGGWTESILQRMGSDVLVVCLPPLHWSDGALVDLDAVGAACRRHGSTFIVDATQGMYCSLMLGNPFYISQSHVIKLLESCRVM